MRQLLKLLTVLLKTVINSVNEPAGTGTRYVLLHLNLLLIQGGIKTLSQLL